MTADQPSHNETLAAFKDSFAYGSRNDLSFKFLRHLCADDAATFFQELLTKLGASLDDGELDRLIQHVVAWQITGYSGPGRYAYEDGPFARPVKPIAATRLALITSTGHFAAGDDPRPLGVEDMSQEEAIRRIGEFGRTAPQLSRIPVEIAPENLRVRHGGYDIRGVQADPNVALPIQRLRELQADGTLGELAAEAYSFVGATPQPAMINEAGPEWANMLSQGAVDAALLVPV